MASVLLVIHLLLAIALIITILLQRSEGDVLGISGGGLMSVRGQANLLTRATAALATLFILTSLGLAILGDTHNRGDSVLDRIDITVPASPAEPITPATPTVPVAPAETPEAPTHSGDMVTPPSAPAAGLGA